MCKLDPIVCSVLVIQPCPILCDPMDCSPPGFSVHGILLSQRVKNLGIAWNAGDAGDMGQSLGWEDPLEKGMAMHSGILLL